MRNLHTQYVYKIIPNENHVVNSWSADEAWILEILSWENLEYDSLILHNCKKIKIDKNCKSENFFYINCAIKVSPSCRIICTKKNPYYLNLKFLNQFLYRVTIGRIKVLFWLKRWKIINM